MQLNIVKFSSTIKKFDHEVGTAKWKSGIFRFCCL